MPLFVMMQLDLGMHVTYCKHLATSRTSSHCTKKLSYGKLPFLSGKSRSVKKHELCDRKTVEPLQIPNIFMINVAAGSRSLWNISYLVTQGVWNEHVAESNCLAIEDIVMIIMSIYYRILMWAHLFHHHHQQQQQQQQATLHNTNNKTNTKIELEEIRRPHE